MRSRLTRRTSGDAKQLVDFSILGAALARALFDQELPTIGLLAAARGLFDLLADLLRGGTEIRSASS